LDAGILAEEQDRHEKPAQRERTRHIGRETKVFLCETEQLVPPSFRRRKKANLCRSTHQVKTEVSIPEQRYFGLLFLVLDNL